MPGRWVSVLRAERPQSLPLLLGLVGALLGVGLLASAETAAAAAVLAAVAVWLWDPVPDAWRAPVFLVLAILPVSTVLTLLLGSAAGEMSRVVAWSPLWREAIVFGLLGLALAGVVAGRIRPSLGTADWFALALAALVILYALFGLGSRGHELGLFQRAAGARAWLVPLAFYFVGRVTPSPGSHGRDLQLVYRLSWFVSVAAFIEFFVLGDRFWQQLEFERYLLAIGTPESGIFRGVTYNYYWLDFEGVPHRRWPAFMGTLTLGYWYLVVLPVVAAWAWSTGSKRLAVVLVVALVALIGSRTRAAIGGMLVALALLALIRARKTSWIAAALGAFILSAIIINVNPQLVRIVAEWLRLPLDPSALGHIAAIIRGTQAVLREPWGFGVGSAGFVGMGFVDHGTRVVGESLYLSLAAEVGWLGTVCFAGWVSFAAVGLGRFALQVEHRSERWILAAGLAAATLGLAIASVTTEVWRGLQAGALYWWLLGTAVTTVRATSPRGDA